MDLIEIFKQRQIEISSAGPINADYLTVRSTADLYALAEGDAVLVKRQLTMEDVFFLHSFSGTFTVFTMEPDCLEAFDALRALEQYVSLQHIASIGFCFLHTDEVLYVFDGHLDEGAKPNTPNVVRLFPVHRRDIETYLSIDKAILSTLHTMKSEENKLQNAPERQVAENQPSLELDQEMKEIELLRKELSNLFSSRYTEVRVEFSGTSPENRTIALSSFYEKHGIEHGRLRGGWNLFGKNRCKSIMDVGLVNRAKEEALKELSVSVPTYGRIIHSEDLENLRKAMEQIADDYRSYLDQKDSCKKVGRISVQNRFLPTDVIEESFSDLAAYLHRIGGNENSNSKYHKAVDLFINNERSKLRPFSDLVELRITSSVYTGSQWENEQFVNRIGETVFGHPDFFDEEIIYLMKRYCDLFDQTKKQVYRDTI